MRHGVHPQIGIPVVFFAFSKRTQLWIPNRFDGNGKISLGRSFSLPSQREFPIPSKPKAAIAKFIWKMKKKSGTGTPLLTGFLETLENRVSRNRVVRGVIYYIKPKMRLSVFQSPLFGAFFRKIDFYFLLI